MSDILVQIIFGWPAIILTIALSVAGILKKWPWMLAAAGVMSIPFSFYFSGYPMFFYSPFLFPFFLFGAAWAVRAKRRVLPWLLLLPLACFSVFLAIIVLSQFG